MPILSVEDIEKSAEFFTVGLGFVLAGRWKDDEGKSTFAIVVMDNITVGLQCGAPKKECGPWAAYFYVQDIDAFAAHIESNGIRLKRQVTDQLYGCRDLEVEDYDRNVLCFGQDMAPSEAGPGL
jgi:catechol 2,3-dioxygenase-like lactoylglutathione lyase family enzyme